jgi:hypothetical protein
MDFFFEILSYEIKNQSLSYSVLDLKIIIIKKNKETEKCTRKATKRSSYSILHKKDAGIASCPKKEGGGERKGEEH